MVFKIVKNGPKFWENRAPQVTPPHYEKGDFSKFSTTRVCSWARLAKARQNLICFP